MLRPETRPSARDTWLRYETYRTLYMPRPVGHGVPRQLFHRYAGWYCQIKKNGTSNVMAISPERHITARDRHRKAHKLWRPTEVTRRAFLGLPGHGWYVFVAELLDRKVTGQRDINYIHDILVADGDYLIGETLADRQQRLLDLFQPTAMSLRRSHYVLDANTWLAINHTANHLALFNSLTAPDDEGVVFKNPTAPLCSCSSEIANSHWQAKSRRFAKNHAE